MRRPHAGVLGVLALLLLTAACGGPDDAQARARIETARQQVAHTLDDLVPLVLRATHAKVSHGDLHYASCHFPVVSDAQVVSEVQLGYSRSTYDATWRQVAGHLEQAGWTLDASGSSAATRDGYEVVLSMEGHYPALALRSPCISTSSRLGKEYAARPRTPLPAPWHPVS